MQNKKTVNVLTIAGFDGSGGAGLQADLKTFSALGCYGASVLTALPVQNTQGVRAIYDIPNSCIEEQLHAILEDIEISTVKIGMLHSPDVIRLVGAVLSRYPIEKVVLDPVMVAKSGHCLLQPEAIAELKKFGFSRATVLTPNLQECSQLLGRQIMTKEDMEKSALELAKMGSQSVIVKGGHLTGESCEDCLAFPNGETYWFSSPRITTKNCHGTGCTFSSAIAAYLAKECTILEAVQKAKIYLTNALQASADWELGHGHGPVHHFHYLWNFL